MRVTRVAIVGAAVAAATSLGLGGIVAPAGAATAASASAATTPTAGAYPPPPADLAISGGVVTLTEAGTQPMAVLIGQGNLVFTPTEANPDVGTAQLALSEVGGVTPKITDYDYVEGAQGFVLRELRTTNSVWFTGLYQQDGNSIVGTIAAHTNGGSVIGMTTDLVTASN